MRSTMPARMGFGKISDILIERGFKSGFLWGQEGYQQFSQVWGKFADGVKQN